MKIRYYLLLLILFFLISCNKDGEFTNPFEVKKDADLLECTLVNLFCASQQSQCEQTNTDKIVCADQRLQCNNLVFSCINE